MGVIRSVSLLLLSAFCASAQLNISSPFFVAGVVKASGGGFDTIAVDATSSSGEKTSSPFTWTHTTGSGNNRALFVGISIHTEGITASAVTYNGVSMTFLRGDTGSVGTRTRTEIWYLAAPATGANTVSVTAAGATECSGGAVSFTGVNQSTPNDVAGGAGATGTSTTASQSITTVTDNAWTFAVLKVHNNNTITIGGGDTQIWDDTYASVNGEASGSRSASAKTPAGSKTMSWTLSPSDDWAISVTAVRPASL